LPILNSGRSYWTNVHKFTYDDNDNDNDNAFINNLWPEIANNSRKRKTQIHVGIHLNNIAYMKYKAIIIHNP